MKSDDLIALAKGALVGLFVQAEWVPGFVYEREEKRSRETRQKKNRRDAEGSQSTSAFTAKLTASFEPHLRTSLHFEIISAFVEFHNFMVK
jgi:hypothetical protein